MSVQALEPIIDLTVDKKAGDCIGESPNSAARETGWEIIIGKVVGLGDTSGALINHAKNSNGSPMKARSVVAIGESDIGSAAVLAFEDGDLMKPIIIGLIKSELSKSGTVNFSADGDKLTILAEREIELRCGESSITLTRAGKVLIKGEYVLTRAKGLNCIKGAAVSIN